MTVPTILGRMIANGRTPHAFVPRRADNSCDACGLGREAAVHGPLGQGRLL